ncbi:MAG TPA: hypothetical protein VNQ79_04995 [Blastocatellia bacterium]|nr:hypothetical protein [Blastocatellia bacterium]
MHKRFSSLIAMLALLALPVVAQVAAPSGAAPAKKTLITAASVEAATKAILEQVGEMRQIRVLSPVKSGTRSRAEIEQMVIRNFNEETRPGEIEASGKALFAFGLVPPGFQLKEFTIKLLTEQVAGFYDPKTKEFFIADWNDLDAQKPVIAHELTHALQDQNFNLRRFEKWPAGDSDREMAIHALIEGDATVLMYDYMLKPMGRSVAQLPMTISKLAEAGMAMAGGDDVKMLKAAPAALRESLIFPYVYGADFVQAMLKRQGWSGVSQAFTDLPQSTEQILHFDKYTAREMPVKVQLNDLSATLGEGWKRLLTDINGEFGYLMILAEYIPKEQARQAAAGWGGDQYALYERASDGKLLIVHRSVWDTAEDATEFVNAYVVRTRKRYPEMKSGEAGPAGQESFITPDGTTLIERQDKSVLIIEGLPAAMAAKAAGISAALRSEAKPKGEVK